MISNLRTVALTAMLAAAMLPLARSADQEHAHHHQSTEADPHAAHHASMAAPTQLVITHHKYELPVVPLLDEHNRRTTLRELAITDRPIVVNFIFSSCTTICPVMTATLTQLQRQLPMGRANPLFVSVSIDPEIDSPAVLKYYAQRRGADWTFLTGPREQVMEVLRGFDAWRGNKANHVAVTLLRAPHATTWTRVEGLATAQQLAAAW
jgi:protein SCO1